ncbi:hypothetical protein [Dactylosporangium sp. NPDC000521]|uniref:hypothetical protein n=1 Tax=Dactylosporangium sp. NPDC000521 TaxID=3363975 RepID=UPI0036ABEDA9
MTTVVREALTNLEGISIESQLEVARADLAELAVNLEIAHQRAEVAITVAQLLGRLVENDGLAYIVVDIVDCWRSLDPEVRDSYPERRVIALSGNCWSRR